MFGPHDPVQPELRAVGRPSPFEESEAAAERVLGCGRTVAGESVEAIVDEDLEERLSVVRDQGADEQPLGFEDAVVVGRKAREGGPVSVYRWSTTSEEATSRASSNVSGIGLNRHCT